MTTHHFRAVVNPDRPRGTFGADCSICGERITHENHDPARSAPPVQMVVWHAWRDSLRVDSGEFPATMSGREVRDHFCDKGLNDGSLRVTIARPLAGMLATKSRGGDSYPYTVVEVSPSGSILRLQARKARGPMTVEDRNGEVIVARRRADGTYRTMGRAGALISFGEADARLDPSF